MSHVEEIETSFANTASIDAFVRSRFSQPFTLFDSKQVHNALALLWDAVEESGSGTSSTWEQNRASSLLAVSNTTAGKRTRQTFQRFNYQPGKSQLVLKTFVLGAAASGITKEVGQFDDNNGIFLRQTGTGLSMCIRSNITGTPVDNEIPQASWNLDKFDGAGPSGITLDATKAQILVFDYEWLGSGRVRIGFLVGGAIRYAHEFKHSNVSTGVYMSTPNNPLRYSIENDGTGVAADFETMCSTVVSEGGAEPTGLTRYFSQGSGHSNANSTGLVYALVGLRLKADALGCLADLVSTSVLAGSSDSYEWFFRINPVVAGTFTYNAVAESCVEIAYGDIVGNPSVNTVTGGREIEGGHVKSGNNSGDLRTPVSHAWHMGASVAGVRDTLVLCVRPLSSNADLSGALTIREAL